MDVVGSYVFSCAVLDRTALIRAVEAVVALVLVSVELAADFDVSGDLGMERFRICPSTGIARDRPQSLISNDSSPSAPRAACLDMRSLSSADS